MNILRISAALLCLVVATSAGAEKLTEQTATKIVIPKVDFRESTLGEAVEYLRMKTRGQFGAPDAMVNIIVAIPPKPRPALTMQRDEGTLLGVLKGMAAQAGCEVQVEPYALVIREKGAGPLPPIRAGEEAPVRAIMAKLDKIVLPQIDFRDATAREAIEFLVQKMKQLDPDGAGVSVTLKYDDDAAPAGPPPGVPGLPAKGGAPPPPVAGIPGLPAGDGQELRFMPRVNFQATQIPILEAMRYAAGMAGLQVTVGKTGVVILPVAGK